MGLKNSQQAVTVISTKRSKKVFGDLPAQICKHFSLS